MVARTLPDDAPEPFQRALVALKSAAVRPEVVLTEAPSPGRIAPYSVALTADVVDRGPGGELEELATGRFVLLYDPAAPEPWEPSARACTKPCHRAWMRWARSGRGTRFRRPIRGP